MSRGEDTRDVVLEAALSQAVVLGLEGLSVGDLATRIGMSKSGVFAHFRSKEKLQLAVLDLAARRFQSQVIRPAFVAAPGSERVERLFVAYLRWMENGAGAGGCLMVTAAQEFDDRPGPVRDRVVDIAAEWRRVIRRTLVEAIESSDVDADADLDQMVFEFMGLALSFQQSARLLSETGARQAAVRGLRRMLVSAPRLRPQTPTDIAGALHA